MRESTVAETKTHFANTAVHAFRSADWRTRVVSKTTSARDLYAICCT